MAFRLCVQFMGYRSCLESNRHSTAGVLVVVDRKARYVQAVKTTSRTTRENNDALLCAVGGMTHIHSLTYDNDIAFQKHEAVNIRLGSASYFCHPYHSWEKGTVEHMNGKLRWFLKKGSDLGRYSQEEIDSVCAFFNHRPMKCLLYQTPYEVMVRNNAFCDRLITIKKSTEVVQLGG